MIKSIKKFTNEAKVKCLVASGAKYSHNQMDGRVSVLTADQLLTQDAQSTAQDLPTQQFFESQTACGDSVVVKVANKIYLVSGFDDGVICLQDLTLMKSKNIIRPVFQTRQGEDEAQALDQGIYDQWHE